MRISGELISKENYEIFHISFSNKEQYYNWFDIISKYKFMEIVQSSISAAFITVSVHLYNMSDFDINKFRTELGKEILDKVKYRVYKFQIKYDESITVNTLIKYFKTKFKSMKYLSSYNIEKSNEGSINIKIKVNDKLKTYMVVEMIKEACKQIAIENARC